MAYVGDEKREYQLRWVSERRDIGYSLLGGKCTFCGSTEKLEVDHINREDKSPLLRSGRRFNWSRSWSFILEELKKCQLLCDACHNNKTSEESKTTTHGLTMYKKHGCRCPICREAKSIENARRSRKAA